MLPSVAQPLASLAPGAATAAAAQPLLPGVAGPAPRAAGPASPKGARPLQDALVPVPERTALLAGAVAARAPRAASSGAGWARTAAATKSPSSAPSTATSATSTAKPAAASSAGSTAKKGPLDFLDDPKLSIEDKLMRLLAHLNDKWEKDLQKKMKELKQSQVGDDAPSAGSSTSSSSAASSAKSGGIAGALGGIVKAATTFFPAVGVGLELLRIPAARDVISKLGGPVLAAAASAMGYPQLAPLALQYGPKLVDLAAGVAGTVGTGAGTAGASGTSSAPSSGSAASKPDGMGLSSDRDAQLKTMEIQRIMEQQKEMFGLVSNILRAGHDGRLSVIQNIR
jgi:hypothetical protein